MYQYESKIRYSQLDSEGRLNLPALLDYFQDASIFHSEDLGVGIEYLKERNMFWALSSWQIVVKRYPTLGEKVTVGTAPYEFKGFIGYRNFWMLDEKGEQIAVANSVWSLVSSKTGKPVRPNEEMIEKYALSLRLEMDYASRKVKLEGEGIAREVMKVMPHHLDTNQHVNNGQYVRIAMDYLPTDFSVHQMRAEYKMQAVLDNEIYPVIYRDDSKIGVSLQTVEGQIYCNVEFD